MLLPCSMVVRESTANGTGLIFSKSANEPNGGESAQLFAFVPWFEIEMYNPAGIGRTTDSFFRLILTDYERIAMAQGCHARSNRLGIGRNGKCMPGMPT